MSLQDLIVQKPVITEVLLEKVLLHYAQLIEGDREVLLLESTEHYLIKHKVLLYLAGIAAWDFIEQKDNFTSISNSQIQNALKIEGNTLRPILKQFRDLGMVESAEDGHAITFKGVKEIESLNDNANPDTEQFKINSGNEFDKRAADDNVIEKKEVAEKQSTTNNDKVSGSKPDEDKRSLLRKELAEYVWDQENIEKWTSLLRELKNIEKYLLVLSIVKDYIGIDGLTSGEIKDILVLPPFKLGHIFTTNISRDLNNNFKTKMWVQPVELAGKFGYVYKLTQKGEEKITDIFH